MCGQAATATGRPALGHYRTRKRKACSLFAALFGCRSAIHCSFDAGEPLDLTSTPEPCADNTQLAAGSGPLLRSLERRAPPPLPRVVRVRDEQVQTEDMSLFSCPACGFHVTADGVLGGMEAAREQPTMGSVPALQPTDTISWDRKRPAAAAASAEPREQAGLARERPAKRSRAQCRLRNFLPRPAVNTSRLYRLRDTPSPANIVSSRRRELQAGESVILLAQAYREFCQHYKDTLATAKQPGTVLGAEAAAGAANSAGEVQATVCEVRVGDDGMRWMRVQLTETDSEPWVPYLPFLRGDTQQHLLSPRDAAVDLQARPGDWVMVPFAADSNGDVVEHLVGLVVDFVPWESSFPDSHFRRMVIMWLRRGKQAHQWAMEPVLTQPDNTISPWDVAGVARTQALSETVPNMWLEGWPVLRPLPYTARCKVARSGCSASQAPPARQRAARGASGVTLRQQLEARWELAGASGGAEVLRAKPLPVQACIATMIETLDWHVTANVFEDVEVGAGVGTHAANLATVKRKFQAAEYGSWESFRNDVLGMVAALRAHAPARSFDAVMAAALGAYFLAHEQLMEECLAAWNRRVGVQCV